jgi:hypothetical protein
MMSQEELLQNVLINKHIKKIQLLLHTVELGILGP